MSSRNATLAKAVDTYKPKERATVRALQEKRHLLLSRWATEREDKVEKWDAKVIWQGKSYLAEVQHRENRGCLSVEIAIGFDPRIPSIPMRGWRHLDHDTGRNVKFKENRLLIHRVGDTNQVTVVPKTGITVTINRALDLMAEQGIVINRSGSHYCSTTGVDLHYIEERHREYSYYGKYKLLAYISPKFVEGRQLYDI